MAGQNTLVFHLTGTGSGKTECFLYPIISKALELREAGVAEGICAVIIYPMNALAEDQLGRLREFVYRMSRDSALACTSARRPSGRGDVTGFRLAGRVRPEPIMPRKWRNCGRRGNRAQSILQEEWRVAPKR